MKGKLKKVLCVAMAVCCMALTFVFGASAAEGAGEVVTMTPDAAIEAAEGLFAQITNTVNFANIAKVLGIGLAAVLGIWLAWFGIRKLFGMLQRVINGKGIRM